MLTRGRTGRRGLGTVAAAAALVVGGGAAASPSAAGVTAAPVAAAVPQIPADGWERIAGPTRYDTAVELSRRTYPDVDPACCPIGVVLASGEGFADALVAGTISVTRQWSRSVVLLVRSDSLPVVVAEELARLRPRRLTVVGGAEAVSDEVVDAARVATGRDDVEVERYGGANRYETAALVADSRYFIWTEGYDPGNVNLASGEDFPDALAATWLSSGANPAPLLLTRRDYLPAATARYLEIDPPSTDMHIRVIGGPAAVSDDVLREAQARRPAAEVIRLAGRNRYETAAAVARGGGFAEPRTAYVVTGEDFPDALVAAPVADHQDAALLLTRQDCHPRATVRVADELAITRFVAVGGADVVYGGSRSC